MAFWSHWSNADQASRVIIGGEKLSGDEVITSISLSSKLLGTYDLVMETTTVYLRV